VLTLNRIRSLALLCFYLHLNPNSNLISVSSPNHHLPIHRHHTISQYIGSSECLKNSSYHTVGDHITCSNHDKDDDDEDDDGDNNNDSDHNNNNDNNSNDKMQGLKNSHYYTIINLVT
jgi:hypothetical protein